MSDQAINQVNINGVTALTLAASNSLSNVCELLIPKMTHQTINQINNIGDTALSLATRNGLARIN